MILIYIFMNLMVIVSIMELKHQLQVPFLMLMLMLVVVKIANLLKISCGQKEQVLPQENIELWLTFILSMLQKLLLDINLI